MPRYCGASEALPPASLPATVLRAVNDWTPGSSVDRPPGEDSGTAAIIRFGARYHMTEI